MTGSKEAAPVEVTNTEPMPVTFDHPVDTTAQTTARTVASAARVDADMLRTEDQRRISGIWERTQQVIALFVINGTLFVVGILVLTPSLIAVNGEQVPDYAVTASVAGMLFLTGAANLVIGFYFGRTNHQRVGGDASPRDDLRGR